MVGKDPHSPYEYPGWRGYKGLVWAQGVWLFFLYERPPEYALHRDLAQDRLVQWQRRAFPFLVAANFLVPLAFYPLYGWNSVLIAGALRTAALMTATGFVNSVCHKWGRRAKDSRGQEYRADDSRNNSFVAIVAGGEGNHSWHHADPACPRHGRRVALDAEAVAAGAKPERGWHPDATWRLIQLLAMLGLIYKVKKPKVTVHFAGKQLVPNQSLRQTHREWHMKRAGGNARAPRIVTSGSRPSKKERPIHRPGAASSVFRCFRRGVYVLGWAVTRETAGTLAGGCGDGPRAGSEARRAGRAAAGGHDCLRDRGLWVPKTCVTWADALESAVPCPVPGEPVSGRPDVR